MGSETGRNQYPPSKEDKDFLNGLLSQSSNDSIINYIAFNFNNIQGRSIRKLKVQDWIYAVDWLKKKFAFYDSDDFDNFCINHFDGHTFDAEYVKSIFKASDLFDLIESYEDMELVGNKNFLYESEEYKAVSEVNEKIYDESLTLKLDNYSNYSKFEKIEVLEMYEMYEEYRKERLHLTNDYYCELLEIDLNGKEDFLKIKLNEEFNSDVDVEIINNACKRYIELKSLQNKSNIINDDLSEILKNEILSFDNLTLIAYYLQYILMSLGLSIQNQTSFGIKKISGKQTDIMQRLLCTVTTKNWERVEQKSNAYYKTINNMYKIEREDEWAKKNLLKQLEGVKEMLIKGKFVDAIRILDEDVDKIIAYK